MYWNFIYAVNTYVILLFMLLFGQTCLVLTSGVYTGYISSLDAVFNGLALFGSVEDTPSSLLCYGLLITLSMLVPVSVLVGCSADLMIRTSDMQSADTWMIAVIMEENAELAQNLQKNHRR